MLVVVKSGPDTDAGRRGVSLARALNADLALVQDGVEFAGEGVLGAFPGRVHVLETVLRLRGIPSVTAAVVAEVVGYGELVDLMAAADRVAGTF